MGKGLEKLLLGGDPYWCFALVNNRLAEIHFIKTKGGRRKIFGHAYIRRDAYKTRREQRMIDKDTKNVILTYRKKKYSDKNGFIK